MGKTHNFVAAHLWRYKEPIYETCPNNSKETIDDIQFPVFESSLMLCSVSIYQVTQVKDPVKNLTTLSISRIALHKNGKETKSQIYFEIQEIIVG